MYTLLNMKEENKAYDNRQQPLCIPLSPISAFRDEGLSAISSFFCYISK